MTEPAEKLTPMAHIAQNRCFGGGPASAIGLHLEFLLAEDGAVVCLPTIPESFEGPPGYLHGGIIATLLDEAMSKTVRARGLKAVTGRMEIDYRRPVRSAAPIRMEGPCSAARAASTGPRPGFWTQEATCWPKPKASSSRL